MIFIICSARDSDQHRPGQQTLPVHLMCPGYENRIFEYSK